MCGIAAILYFDNSRKVDETLLRSMTDSMSHRGPDDSGYWIDGFVGLGHRRLSIIDLSPSGHQPMCNEDGSIWITYNGEIYNYSEIRLELEAKGHTFRSQSDTEVILHAYEEWEDECQLRFNGMWAFAVWDSHRRRLFVSRDRLGIKPLVYYADSNRFICASEIKAIIADRSVPREIDPEALHHYLSFMNVPAPFTIFQGIHKLRPGHYLVVDNGCIEEHRYWETIPGEESKENDVDILTNLEYQLRDAVHLHLVSDVPVSTFLSGGIDSSIISAMAADRTGGLDTYTVSFRDLQEYDESNWASKVASHIGARHHALDVNFDFTGVLPHLIRMFDEPFAVSSAIALYEMSREVAKKSKVVLTGDGADEVFGGYWRHGFLQQYLDCLNHPLLSWYPRYNTRVSEPPIRWRTSEKGLQFRMLFKALAHDDRIYRPWSYFQNLYCYNETEKRALYTPEWRDAVKDTCTDELLLPLVPNSAPNNLSRWLTFEVRTALADEMLAKVDKATMACSLEARVPFLDYRVVEYGLTLPARMKIQGKTGKIALRKLGRRYLPEDVMTRRKHGFNVPLKPWFKKELRDFVHDSLESDSLKQDGIFNPMIVMEILRRHEEDPESDYSNNIFVLLCFQLWKNILEAE